MSFKDLKMIDLKIQKLNQLNATSVSYMAIKILLKKRQALF